MKDVTNDGALDVELLEREVTEYDATIARGKPLFNDDQLRRFAQLRNWRGDRLRTCNFQQIVDTGAMPLIAIRMTVMARKSLGASRPICSHACCARTEALSMGSTR